MATERRRSNRVDFERGHDAWIMGIDGTWKRQCVMKDASQSGAKLVLGENVANLASTEFFLLLSSTGLAYRRCNLVWVNGEEIGVEFLRAGKTAGLAKKPVAI